MYRFVRRVFIVGLMLILASGFAGFAGLAVVAQSNATPVPRAGIGALVVADPAAEAIYAFDLADYRLTASLSGITLNTHAGFLPLPDGRLLVIDDDPGELVTLTLDAGQTLTEASRVAVPGPVTHVAVNPALTHVLVGATDPAAPLTLVDLATGETASFQVAAGEAGVMLGDDPLTAFHRNDALLQAESYPVADLLAAEGDATPASTVPTGAFGHGEAIDHARGRLYLATDDGFDVVAITPAGLAYDRTLPWAPDGRAGGRAYFARVTPDGDTLVSYIADRGDEATPWGEWTNDVYLVDLETVTPTRVPLAPGLVYRFAQADEVALFFSMHPDGDQALVVDTNPVSPTYGEVITTIPLPALSAGPAADESPWEAESRIAAITPDGATGFISAGGEGTIAVLDLAAGEVAGAIDVPSALTGGGYLLVVTPGAPLTDTVGR